MLRFAQSAIVTLLALSLTGAAMAETREVDIELVLLADASGSIDEAELRFQREGYAAALTDPNVLRAINSGARQRIALTYVEWATSGSQAVIVPWAIIDGPEAAQRFAAELTDPAKPRMTFGGNAIGEALKFGQNLIETNDARGDRLVIDLSADSANSWSGIPLETARQTAIAAGITINGLAILCRDARCSGRPVGYDLEEAFERTIIGGPGAFVVTAEDRASFETAVRRKLILEISALPDDPATGQASKRHETFSREGHRYASQGCKPAPKIPAHAPTHCTSQPAEAY